MIPSSSLALFIGQAVMEACQRALDKHRPLSNINLDSVVQGALDRLPRAHVDPITVVIDASGGLHHAATASVPCDVIVLDTDEDGGDPGQRAEIAGVDTYFTRFEIRDDASGLDPDYCDIVDLATTSQESASAPPHEATDAATLIADQGWNDQTVVEQALQFIENEGMQREWTEHLRSLAELVNEE